MAGTRPGEPDRPEGLAGTLERGISKAVPDAAGPVKVIGSKPGSRDTTDYEVSTTRLVSLGPADPSLADVFVPVPVTGHVKLAADGTVAADLPGVDEATSREVQAWARSLIASGSVAGIKRTGPAHGPPQRPTHEIKVDANGRRVLRRIGYSVV